MGNNELIALWSAMRAGKAAAERDFVNACLPKLTAILRRRFVYLPQETIEDAVSDALIELMTYHERYNPQLGSLLNYLVHIGEHKLLDELRRLTRRQEKYVGGTVELALIEANQFRESDYEAPGSDDPDALPPDVQALLDEILPDPADCEALTLILQGRTSVAEFAAIWGMDHTTTENQEASVKRNRDRIMKKVKRKQNEFRRLLYGEN